MRGGTTGPSDLPDPRPYYALNDRMMGVAGLAGDPAYRQRRCRSARAARQARRNPRPRLQPSRVALCRRIVRSRPRPYEGRAHCPSISGRASPAVRRARKASTDITYWPLAIRRGSSCAPGVVYGRSRSAPTACGRRRLLRRRRRRAPPARRGGRGSRATASGTPRLLLHSRSPQFPDGLANRNGLVRQEPHLHPYAMVLGVFDELLEGYKGPTGCSLMSHEFYATTARAASSGLFLRGAARLRRSPRPTTA